MFDKFDHYFMEVASCAARLSSAQRLRVGCVLARNKRLLSTGYNGTPTGYHTNVCEELDSSGNLVTNSVVLHAEQNAILQMAASTESAVGATMYSTHACCVDCAKFLAQAGIVRFIYKYDYRQINGLDLLTKLNIKVERYAHDDFD
jgi:dCMP deaminase